MILSHCMRDAALRVLCEYTIEIYKVLFLPLIALMHCVIARRLCERTLTEQSDGPMDTIVSKVPFVNELT